MKKSELAYTIIYTNRKTVNICINGDGSVSVRAPSYVRESEIHHIIQQKMDWIIKKQNQLMDKSQMVHNKYQRNYDENSTMPLQGKEYPIRLIKFTGLKIPVVSFEQDYFQVRIGEYDKQKIKAAFISWYMKKAKVVYTERIAHFHAIIKEPFGVVRIKEQKSCYGSCSSKRNMNFNWKCILAPIEVLDYIVVHEMCHLKEMNHSKQFWTLVNNYFPNYKDCKRWLRENNAFLEI